MGEESKSQNYYKLALEQYNQSNFLQVKHLLKKVIDENPKHIPSIFLLAQVLEKEGDFSSSKSYYDSVIKKDPNFFDARFRLSSILYQERKYKEAVEVLKKAIHLKSDDYQSYFILGNCYQALRQLDEASKAYYKALHYEPNYSAAHLNLANCLRLQRYSNDALFHYQKAIEIEPNNFNAQRAFASFASELLILTLKTKPYEVYQQALEKIKALMKNSQILFRYLHTHLLMNEHWKEGFRLFIERDSIQDRENKQVELYPKPFENSLKGQNILFVKEQGLGDTIFFLRFLRLLKGKEKNLHLISNEKFIFLFESLGYFKEIHSDIKDFSVDSFDRRVLVGDLPYLTSLNDDDPLPLPFPITPQPDSLQIVKRELEAIGPGPYIAINWGKSFENEENYFVKDFCHAIKDVPATFISTQYHPDEKDTQTFKEILPSFVDFSHYNKHLDRLVALLFLVHDYYGVSNTNTHIRGSFNKAFSVFVPYPNHWYWTQKDQSLLWFPKGRAFFQSSNGSWELALRHFNKLNTAK
ncbi:MAG: tetratricopeptide repeat protein [Chlamydiales bacterium]|nr:tetratricopeptide repeat protein [Chlamydiales bacterium]